MMTFWRNPVLDSTHRSLVWHVQKKYDSGGDISGDDCGDEDDVQGDYLNFLQAKYTKRRIANLQKWIKLSGDLPGKLKTCAQICSTVFLCQRYLSNARKHFFVEKITQGFRIFLKVWILSPIFSDLVTLCSNTFFFMFRIENSVRHADTPNASRKYSMLSQIR